MIFNNVLGVEIVNEKGVKINHREAVRSIILQGNKLLLVQTNKGDFKFPGGGLKNKEKHEDAIRREVMEETGYIITAIKEKIGVFTERNVDEFDEESIFEMISYYYLCEVLENQGLQQLDDYEEELDFSPQWISIEEAIINNMNIIKKKNEDMNKWIFRDTAVLNELKRINLNRNISYRERGRS